MTERDDPAITAIGRIDTVPSILEVCCRVTGMGFAAVARVTETEWTACAVRDEIAFGLAVGGQLDVQTTLCDAVRSERDTIVFDHAAEDPRYADHHTPRLYGLQSYISTPIIRSDGRVFGTLCAIDPDPHHVSKPETVETFKLFAQLIAAQLDADERLAASETALLDQAAASVLQEQFIAVLGHDLRNPLAGADAGALLLQRMELPDKAQSIISAVRASHARMGRLIDDVLDFARGRLGGGVSVEPRPHADLADALEQVVQEMRSAHPHRAIATDLSITDEVAVDRDRLGQLLSNLLGNALTHGAPEGEIRVIAVVRDGLFELSVSNPGDPIPDHVMPGLFEPFHRGAADKGNRDGLGLGLYIASQIAQAHGGMLEVTSDAGETTFRFRMPGGATAWG
ncbi:GAF domain-containing sensor histidine kinase [Brevundimonas sp.]|uniref:GAF domain-containing sensor histidine kinase n=1 Tax=Brevundimonas sp. TaxID=1871086 RepID=UPI003D0B9D85